MENFIPEQPKKNPIASQLELFDKDGNPVKNSEGESSSINKIIDKEEKMKRKFEEARSTLNLSEEEWQNLNSLDEEDDTYGRR